MSSFSKKQYFKYNDNNNLIKKIIDSSTKIYDIVENTKLEKTKTISNKLNSNIYFKREDLQKI